MWLNSIFDMLWRTELTQGRREPDPENPGSPKQIFQVEKKGVWPETDGHIEHLNQCHRQTLSNYSELKNRISKSCPVFFWRAK